MMTVTRFLPHPIIFVFDFSTEDIVIPEYDPELIVSANEACLSIHAMADVDGEVTITLAKHPPTESIKTYKEVFYGEIKTLSGKIAVITSQNEKILEEEVSKPSAAIRIFVDEREHPSKIWIELP